MKTLKVAVVIPTHFDVHSSLGNLLKVYRHLIKYNNLEVTIFTDRRNNVQYKDFKVEKIKGIDYKTIFEKFLLVLGIPRFYYSDLTEKLLGYDVVESSNPEFYAFAYQAYKGARRYGERLIYRTSQTVEGFYFFNFSKYFVVPFTKKAYDYAKFLLFTNPQAEKRCLDLGLMNDKKRSIVIGHATDTKCFRPLKVKKKNKIVLLSVGGLYKIKGHHLIIQALKKIINKGIKAELWIVGEGNYKSNLINLTKQLEIENKVKFLGKRSHDELALIYNGADIFILANFQEITPAVNEALACEKPVVVMECGGRDFVIPNSNYGMIAKRFDVDDISSKVIYLLKNRDVAFKLAKKGRKHILRNFSIEKVASKIYDSFTR